MFSIPALKRGPGFFFAFFQSKTKSLTTKGTKFTKNTEKQ